jgi:hypothetical protein
MGIGQSKEGFSVFGIFNQCVSPMGKRLLRLWFRRPIIHLEAIQDRQVSARSSPPPSVCKMHCASCPSSSMGLAPVPTTPHHDNSHRPAECQGKRYCTVLHDERSCHVSAFAGYHRGAHADAGRRQVAERHPEEGQRCLAPTQPPTGGPPSFDPAL